MSILKLNYIKIKLKEFLKLYKISRTEIHRELAGTASSHNRVLYFSKVNRKSKKNCGARNNIKVE